MAVRTVFHLILPPDIDSIMNNNNTRTR